MAYAFPEHNYRPADHFAAGYHARVQRGREIASQSTVAICGLARDIESRIPRLIEAMTAIGGLFSDYRIHIYENDSVDRTKPLLEAWSKRDPRVHFRSETIRRLKWASVRSGVRADHMADYRNACHDSVGHVVARTGQQPDYVVVMDTDLGGWSLDGILSSIGTENWDAMGANGLQMLHGRIVQYDVWAWRDLKHPHAHPATEINPRVYDRGHPPVPVLSCFGGMGVYKGPAYMAARYRGGDCEHVLLHTAMAAAGYSRIFLNPGMVTMYGP